MSTTEIINGEAVECFTMEELIKQHNDERRRFVNHELEKAIELIKEQDWIKLFHKASFVPELFPIVMPFYDKIPYENKAEYKLLRRE